MKNNILKKLPILILAYLDIVSIFLLLRYQEVNSLESVYMKKELFKLCRKGKVNIYGWVTGEVWRI